jgi:predicted negative regulator of RcsB-dependent stress response
VRAETRHQLKQDAFSRVTIATAEKTAHWTVEHRSTLLIAGTAVAVVLAAVLGGWYYLTTQDEKASFDFAQAVRTMNAQFQAIADKYPHTRTADMAHYFLGVTAADAGDNAAAERDLKQVAGGGNGELASMAKLALASLYGDTNRVKEAVALYQELMKKPTKTVSKVTAQLQLADLYEASNQPLDAKRTYEEIKKENPAGEAAQLATQKLADLK